MFRSVKSQIVFATSLIIILILSATAYFVIDQKTKEINQDIFSKAVSFAELTHERIVDNYETNYKNQAYAHFDRELSDIYSLNQDITGIAIFNYKGEPLYRSDQAKEELLSLSEDNTERIKSTYPSIKIKKSERIVYIEKIDNKVAYTNYNGKEVDPVLDTEQIYNVYYTFRDPNNSLRVYSIYYGVTYDALISRIQETATNIIIMMIFGIVISLFVGGMVAGKITAPIKKLTKGAKEIGTGNLDIQIDVKSKSEIGMLADTFNHMTKDLKVSTKAMVEKEKISRELELAGEIQAELLPKEMPKFPGIDVAASVKAADEVGGDCYDFIELDKDNLLFYIGDVTGHGVSAGLVSAINNALVPAFVDRYTSTKDLIVQLNRILKMKTRPNMFMTMVMASWNQKTKKVTFTQAGHDPIVHYKASSKDIAELSVGGMALGMIPDLSSVVKPDSIALKMDDVLVLYTDGIPEAWQTETESYGMDRLKESIKKNSALKTAQQIHDAILKDVYDFMGEYPQADDITLIVVKRNN